MTIDQLIEKIKVRCGVRSINVELHNDDILECIDDATYKFIEHHRDGAIPSVYQLKITDATEYELPDYIRSILYYYRYKQFVTPELEQVMLTQLNVLFDNTNLVNYVVFKDYVETIDRLLVVHYDFSFNETTNFITFRNIPEKGSSIYLYCYEATSGNHAEKLYSNNWFVRYCTALAKMKWGEIASKYEITLTNGNRLNGDLIYTRGKEEREILETELYTIHKDPINFFIG